MQSLRNVLVLAVAGVGYLTTAALVAQQPGKKDKDKGPMLPPVNPAIAKLELTIPGLEGPAFDVAAGGEKDKELIAVACESGHILAYKRDALPGAAKGAAKPDVWQGHQGPVVALAWGGGPLLASAGADKKINFWNAQGKVAHSAVAPANVRCLAMSKDGKVLASGGEDNIVQLWDVATGKPKAKLADHKDWVLCLAFSPDGKQLASGDVDGQVRLWDVAAGKKIKDLPAKPNSPPKTPPEPNAARSLVFLPDGKTLLVGTSDGPILAVNLADGKVARTMTGHTGPVTAMALHPSGNVLATSSKDRTVLLWNPTANNPAKKLEGHKAWVEGLTFFDEGRRIASAGADQQLLIWDLAEPKKK
jgi:WD40 repeat protein